MSGPSAIRNERFKQCLSNAVAYCMTAAKGDHRVLVAGVCKDLLGAITATTGPHGRSLIGEARLTLVSSDPRFVGKQIPITIDSGKTQVTLDVADVTTVNVADYDVLIIRQDSGLLSYLDELCGQRPPLMPVTIDDSSIMFSKIIENEDAYQLAVSTNQSSKGGLCNSRVVEHLYTCVNHILDQNVAGDILNFGVAWGWSMAFIAEILVQRRETSRRLIGFDTFAGFVDENDARDQYVSQVRNTRELETGGFEVSDTNISYQDCDYESVAAALRKYPMVELVVGDIKKTIHELDSECIALAFYDMDDYTPTLPTLQPVYDRLSPGGVMMHDHFSLDTTLYSNTWGQRRAMREFLKTSPMFNLTGTNAFIKF